MQAAEKRICVLFVKVVFLILVGVYVLSLPAAYFLLLHATGDFLMPFDVSLCFGLSALSFLWVSKVILELQKELQASFKNKM